MTAEITSNREEDIEEENMLTPTPNELRLGQESDDEDDDTNSHT